MSDVMPGGPVLDRPVRARIATTGLFLAAGLAIGFWAACIPAIKAGLSLSDGALGIGLLAFAGGAILAMPFSGWIAARFGSHRVATLAGGVLALGLPLPGLAGSLPLLVAAALLVGAANGMLDVSMNAHATVVERRWGRPIMSSFHAAFSLGGLSGAAIAGLLLSQGLPVQACLAVAAVLVAASAGAAPAIGLRRGLLSPDEAAAPDESPHAAFALPSREQLGLGFLTFLTMLVEGAVADWSGVFLVTVAGASISAAAGGYAAFSVAMVGCRLLGDRIVLRLGDTRVLRLGGVLAAAGLAIALGVALPGAASLGFGLVGLGVANMVPVLFSAAGRSRLVAPSVGVAMVATLGYAGFLIGPPLIGLGADVVGLRWALLALPVAALVIAGRARRVLAPRPG